MKAVSKLGIRSSSAPKVAFHPLYVNDRLASSLSFPKVHAIQYIIKVQDLVIL